MAYVRRNRFVITNYVIRRRDGGGVVWTQSIKQILLLQDADGAVCWRCKKEYRRGDNLVHIQINSDDVMRPEHIYHYRCIPSARWHVGKLAGSLPAWELPTDESPAEKTGTSSAVAPTNPSPVT